MQFVPDDHMTSTGADGKPELKPTTITVALADALGNEVDKATQPILVRPARFSTTAGGNWEGGNQGNALDMKRKDVVLKGNAGTGTVSANVHAGWALRSGQEEVDAWLAKIRIEKPNMKSFSIGDFKGYIVEEPLTYKQAAYSGDVGWTAHEGIKASGTGAVVKGRAAIHFKYSVSSGTASGVEIGKAPYESEGTAARNEARAILDGLKVTADGNIKVVPWTSANVETPKEMKVTLTAATTKPKYAQAVDVTATVTGGTAPYKYEWTGDHAGKGNKVTFVSRMPGNQKLAVKVTDATGSSAFGEVVMTVEATNTTIKGLPAQIVYGQSAEISTNIPANDPSQGAVTDLDGEVASDRHAVWHATPNLTFNPPQGATTHVTFSEMGKIKIWATLHAKDGSTVGEADQAVCEVVAPRISLEFSPSSGAKIGEEVKATLKTAPLVPEELLRIVWLEPATSQKLELNKSGTQISFKAPEPGKPIAFHAVLRVPGSGDTIGEVKGTYSGSNYQVTVKVLDPETTRATYWDPVRKAHVSPPKGTFVVDERVRLRAELVGVPKVDEVRWAWKPNEGTTLTADGGNENTASRHEPGSAEVNVIARDKEGRTLGAGTVTFGVVGAESNPAAVPAVPLNVSLPARVQVPQGEKFSLKTQVVGGKPPYTFRWYRNGMLLKLASADGQGTAGESASMKVEVVDATGQMQSQTCQIEVLPATATPPLITPPTPPTPPAPVPTPKPPVTLPPPKDPATKVPEKNDDKVPVAAALSVTLNKNLIQVAPAESFRLMAQPAGGKPPYTYSWTSNGSLTEIKTIGLKATRSQDTTFTVNVRDSDGKTATATCQVKVQPATNVNPPEKPTPPPAPDLTKKPPVTLPPTKDPAVKVPAKNDDKSPVAAVLAVTLSQNLIKVATGESFNLKAQPAGGKPPYTYSWTSDGILTKAKSGAIKATRTKDSSLTVEVRDSAGKTASATCQIKVQPAATAGPPAKPPTPQPPSKPPVTPPPTQDPATSVADNGKVPPVVKPPAPVGVSAYAGEHLVTLTYSKATPSGITSQTCMLEIKPNGDLKVVGHDGSSLMSDMYGTVDASGNIKAQAVLGQNSRLLEGRFAGPTSASGKWNYKDSFVGTYGGTWTTTGKTGKP
jgi:hypothetical protein